LAQRCAGYRLRRRAALAPDSQHTSEAEVLRVTQSISSAEDVVEYLKAQHETIKQLFIETLDAADTASREDAFTRLRTLLAVHETAEEMMVHPRVRRKIENGGEVVDARLAEEHDAKEALAELEKLDISTADFTKALIHLQAAVLKHAENEETEEFPLLEQQLDEDELQKLTVAVQAAERIAPTHPHAGVESGAANFAIGPFVSLLDRARDAIGKAVA
jgi:hemerythrin superfamily protein